jgi:hypothetical protein
MRRQDKRKVILEANKRLEESYLNGKGLVNEEEMSFEDYANKIAQEHQLILYPNNADKPELAKLYSNAKGDFKGKQGVIAFDRQTSVISLLSLNKELNDVIYMQFKKEWSADDTGYEKQGFYTNSEGKGGAFDYDSEPPRGEGDKVAYYKSFKINFQK